MANLFSGWRLLAVALVALVAIGAAMLFLEPESRKMAIAGNDPASSPSPQPSASAKPKDERFVIKRILPIKGPIRYGEWHWDDKDVPDGPIVATVDLQARVISVFKGGYEIGAAAVLLGSQEKPTPTGVFPITQKRRHHTSSIYDAPMPYMQRLTDDGISLHATTVELGYASHGCIGMPDAFAAKVFETTKVGDVVYITDGKTAEMGDSLVES